MMLQLILLNLKNDIVFGGCVWSYMHEVFGGALEALAVGHLVAILGGGAVLAIRLPQRRDLLLLVPTHPWRGLHRVHHLRVLVQISVYLQLPMSIVV